jgi:hypothetical protein
VTVLLVDGAAGAGGAEIIETAIPDQTGNFQMESLRPGPYRLFAIQDFDEDDWGDPKLAAALAAKSVAVDLKESEKRQVELPPITSEEWTAAVERTPAQEN